ncbi:MAG TPA: ATP-binding protein [Gaiellaceae bacterium]|jgi:serine/threonine-protein kinase RsbW
MSALEHDWFRTVRLTIPAKAEFIGLGRLALSGLARLDDSPLPDEVVADLKLALTEACTNAVRHAYDGGEGLVEIVYERYPDRFVIEVADDGEGFDLEPARTLAGDDELVEGGLGIAIIRALADELELSGREQGGARLRFVKRLPVATV